MSFLPSKALRLQRVARFFFNVHNIIQVHLSIIIMSNNHRGMQIESAHIDEIASLLEKIDEVPVDFDPVLWRAVVEKVLVGEDEIRFFLKSDREYRFRIY